MACLGWVSGSVGGMHCALDRLVLSLFCQYARHSMTTLVGVVRSRLVGLCLENPCSRVSRRTAVEKPDGQNALLQSESPMPACMCKKKYAPMYVRMGFSPSS